MEQLEKELIATLKEEHQDWVTNLREAEEKGEGVDVNLGGNFADRMEAIMSSLRTFKERHKGRKGIFG